MREERKVPVSFCGVGRVDGGLVGGLWESVRARMKEAGCSEEESR